MVVGKPSKQVTLTTFFSWRIVTFFAPVQVEQTKVGFPNTSRSSSYKISKTTEAFGSVQTKLSSGKALSLNARRITVLPRSGSHQSGTSSTCGKISPRLQNWSIFCDDSTFCCWSCSQRSLDDADGICSRRSLHYADESQQVTSSSIS
jgi:hypothetical protein